VDVARSVARAEPVAGDGDAVPAAMVAVSVGGAIKVEGDADSHAEPVGRATHGTDNSVIAGGAVPALARDLWAWIVNAATVGDVNAGPLNASRTWDAYSADSDVAILVANERREYSTLRQWQEELCDALWLPILP
jgi:hypothetical protein